MDRKPLGNVRGSTLRQIRAGPAYQSLRGRYERDEIPECAACIFRAPAAETGGLRTAWGWHDRDDSGTLWSRTSASFECESNGHDSLVLSGLLPPGDPSNTVEFLRNGKRIAFVRNDGVESLAFSVSPALEGFSQISRFVALVEHGFSPWRRGLGSDARELGFALLGSQIGPAALNTPKLGIPRTRESGPILISSSAC